MGRLWRFGSLALSVVVIDPAPYTINASPAAAIPDLIARSFLCLLRRYRFSQAAHWGSRSLRNLIGTGMEPSPKCSELFLTPRETFRIPPGTALTMMRSFGSCGHPRQVS